MSRLRSLQDLATAGLEAIAECKGCGHRAQLSPEVLLRAIPGKWRRSFEYEGSKLRCSACGHKGARLAPAPKIVCPLDCEEFRTDVEAMWKAVVEREMHELKTQADCERAIATLRAAAGFLDDGSHESLVEELHSITNGVEASDTPAE